MTATGPGSLLTIRPIRLDAGRTDATIVRMSNLMRFLLSGSAAVLLSLTACAIRVTPPVELEHPQTIFIADYGRHASLLLPAADGRLREFAFGEWEWFALGNDQWYRVGPALLWPTVGTLGTREFDGPAEIDAIRKQIPAQRIHELRVEQDAAAALLARLDQRVSAGADEKVLNSELAITFVPHADRYCLFRECNSVVAGWLRELGCRVTGSPFSTDFIVQEQPGGSESRSLVDQADAARSSFFSVLP